MDKAIAHLSAAFPLRTPEWSAWSAAMRPPQLAGRWALSGYQLGKGPIYGEVRIGAVPEGPEDEFTTEAKLVYARSGQRVSRTGKGIVYTGFQWRGRSFDGPGEANPLREVLFVDREWQQMNGRWFTGAYDETGIDVKLRRIGRDPILLGTDVSSLRTGASGRRVRITGANLPVSAGPRDVDFGPGVKVARIVNAGAEALEVEVDVDANAAVGARDLFVGGASLPAALVVYDRIDALRVTPAAGLARVGGANFPKQLQQFEAVAVHNGADGKPDTKDDITIGAVDATWSIEEYTATFGDDDKEYVGAIDASGLFTPNIDGPNPKRKNGTNNYGDVWVVAVYTPPAGSESGAKGAKPLRARAHLVVTVPIYMKWDQPEVAR
jgi:quinohemoprotein amine dehydrogenase